MPNLLELVDYRRQVLEIYREVRVRAESDPAGAHLYWRTARDQLFRVHSQSALDPQQKHNFKGLHYYNYRPEYRFEVPVVLDNRDNGQLSPRAPGLKDYGEGEREKEGELMRFSRFGQINLPFGRLEIYWFDLYGGGIFLPFRDGTNGNTTYGGGRYLLDTIKGADLGSSGDGSLILDFNFAYHPSCHYNPTWICPLAPPANRLTAKIEAGEQKYE